MPDPTRTPTWQRVMFAATLANMAGMIPFFFIGAFGPSIRLELGLDEFQLGVAAASFNVGAMLSVFQAGRVGERYGYRRAVVWGCVATIAGMAVGSTARDFTGLLLALTAAGCGNALVQPAANAIIARWIPARRQGLAFGLKQGSVPAAALIAGLSLAALSAEADWRRIFLLGAVTPAVAAVVVARVLPRDGATRAAARRDEGDRIFRTLILFALAAFLASSAASAVAAFAAEAAIFDGLSQRSAGLWYVLGAGAGIVARVAWGAAGSRLGHRVFLAGAALMVLGAVGPALLALDPGPVLRAVGTILAWGAGWGWPGLFHYGIVRTNPVAPATASGVILTGLFGGSVAGPALFGAGVTTLGWRPTWQLCAVCFVLAGVTLVAAHRRAAIPSIWPVEER